MSIADAFVEAVTDGSLLIAMPAAVFVFPGLRARANEGVTDWSVDRAAHKEYMREELTGRE